MLEIGLKRHKTLRKMEITTMNAMIVSIKEEKIVEH